MGLPLQRRSVRAMLKRWKRDEQRLEKLFNGPVDTDDLTTSGEILRNLGSAIAFSERFSAPPKSE